MFKKVLVVAFAVATVGALAGCDEEALNMVAPDAAKSFVAAQEFQAGDGLMDRLQTQYRLQDGTGVNCPDPGTPGECDGSGPYGSGGYGAGSGQGTGERIQLRDGSCGN